MVLLMFGKESQHSFARKWLLGEMSGKNWDMVWIDMDGIPANMEICHVPPTWRETQCEECWPWHTCQRKQKYKSER